MRHILSTAITAVVVSLLTLTVAGAMAQTEPAPEPGTDGAIAPSAVRASNSDRVDGRHAVGAAATKAQRANKLVATNRFGMLPGNIVKPFWGLIQNKPADLADGRIAWGEVTNKPAALADGRIGWGEVANKPAALADGRIAWGEVVNKPAGFADGVDDRGVTALNVRRVEQRKSVSRGGFFVFVDCPSGSYIVGGGFETPFSSVSVHESSPSDRNTWLVSGNNNHSSSVVVRGYAICLTTTPAGAISGSANY